jgi:hypothetical protein
MADEFAQIVKGPVLDTDTILSTDGLAPVAVKKGTAWAPLEVDATSGGLKVDIVDATGLTISVELDPDTSGVLIYGTTDGGTTQTPVLVDSAGQIKVFASDFDIRDLTHVSDSVKVGDGTEFIAVNTDGSINVNIVGAGDSVYIPGNANCIKDTPTTIVTHSPSSDERFKSIVVSGAGLCQWTVKFGTTGSEATILEFWTTPSNPTQTMDIPDSLLVSSGETLLVQATNREKAATPTSDFTGFATLIRGV